MTIEYKQRNLKHWAIINLVFGILQLLLAVVAGGTARFSYLLAGGFTLVCGIYAYLTTKDAKTSKSAFILVTINLVLSVIGTIAAFVMVGGGTAIITDLIEVVVAFNVYRWVRDIKKDVEDQELAEFEREENEENDNI